MGYELLGRVHALALQVGRRARASSGQGTVEYVALVLLIAAVMVGVVAAAGGLKGGNIAQTVVAKIKEAIDGVGKRP